MRKPAFYICENKDADQLRGSLAADQRLCFSYIECTIAPLIPLLSKSEILFIPINVRPCQKPLKTGFLKT